MAAIHSNVSASFVARNLILFEVAYDYGQWREGADVARRTCFLLLQTRVEVEHGFDFRLRYNLLDSLLNLLGVRVTVKWFRNVGEPISSRSKYEDAMICFFLPESAGHSGYTDNSSRDICPGEASSGDGRICPGTSC